MKINSFSYINLIVFFLLIVSVAAIFYKVERDMTLQYVVERVNQDIYRLELEVQRTMQGTTPESIQATLDQYSSIDPIIKRLSISLDQKTIHYSSSRSMISKEIDGVFSHIDDMLSGIKEDKRTRFFVDIPYYKDNEKRVAYLYVVLNENYLYERLSKIAFLYGGVLFVTLLIITIFTLNIVKWSIVRPLREITSKIGLREPKHKSYIITELNQLDKALCESITTIDKQQREIELALEETIYLDGILRTVADVNQLLLTSENLQSLLDSSCERLVEDAEYELCFMAFRHSESLLVEATSKEIDGFIYHKMPLCGMVDCFINSSISQNKITTIDLRYESLPYEDYDEIAKSMGFVVGISIPIVSDVYSEPLGVMVLYTRHDEFKQKEIDMLAELAGDIGFAVKSYRYQDELNSSIYLDKITALPNRQSLTDRLRERKLYAIAIINIDRFSEINELYGIGMGDSVLERYAAWLADELELDDTIEIYKLHSDEFALLMDNCVNISNFIDRIRYIIEKTKDEIFDIDDIEINLSITAGIAHLDERVLEYATLALKKAKSTQSSLELYSSDFKKDQSNNIVWYKKIKDAIDSDRIVPYFQPIVSNVDGSIIKHEALIRLIDEDGSIISPFFFLDISKKTKLYPELTKIVIDKSIIAFKGKDMKVSINLSTQDLVDKNLADYIEKAIIANKMGRFIEFEILESEGIENYTSVMEFVERFKDLGCSFAIDDFGSGYSNFEHLLKLNIDTLKIDGSLIRNLQHDKNAQIFVRHICEFAHEIGVFVIAEFVSSGEILEQVKKIGIDASQGFYFYEPADGLVELR